MGCGAAEMIQGCGKWFGGCESILSPSSAWIQHSHKVGGRQKMTCQGKAALYAENMNTKTLLGKGKI